MPMRNPALFSRIFNTPLMIQPSKLDAIVAGISGRWGLETIPQPQSFLTQQGVAVAPNYTIVGNVAVVDIFGVLSHRGIIEGASSYIVGYDHYAAVINSAISDPKVKAILLQIDSPGGEVAGAFELAALIKEAGKTKPIKAVISSMAASAGYLIASAASDIAISDTGLAGSIGIVMRHIDMSKAAEMDGISITYIYAGAHKVDGNSFEPLPKVVKADMQSQIDRVYRLLIQTISANRSLSTEAIRAQEAQIYFGQDAIAAGLADRISTPDQILVEMQSSFSTTRRSITMSNQDKPDAALEQQALDKARAEGFTAGQAEGRKDGIKTERDRYAAVMAHAEYAGREATANHMLATTDMAADAIAGVLVTMPKTSASAPASSQSQFEQHMAKTTANLGAGAATDGMGDEETDEQLAAKVVAIHNRTRGIK
jgi:capsid assembly protease